MFRFSNWKLISTLSFFLCPQDLKSGRTCLHMASEVANVELLNIFLNQQTSLAAVNIKVRVNDTSSWCQKSRAHRLLFDTNKIYGSSPMSMCSLKELLWQTATCVRNKGIVCFKTFSGNTALHIVSCLQNHKTQVEAVKLLMRKGADPGTRNFENELPSQLVPEGPIGEKVRF